MNTDIVKPSEMSSSSKMNVFVFEGLANRINCLASALATGREITLYWANNSHCPVNFEDLFSDFNQITQVINERVSSYEYIRSENELCWFYVYSPQESQKDEILLKTLQDSYDLVMKDLFRNCSHKSPQGQHLGINFRKHFPFFETLPIKPFLQLLNKIVRNNGTKCAWVSSDDPISKQMIIEFLESKGIHCLHHEYKLLQSDLDRSDDNILGFIEDLAGLSHCSELVVNSTRSTIADPHLISGNKIHYTFDDGIHRRKHQPQFYDFENKVIYNYSGVVIRFFLEELPRKLPGALNPFFRLLWSRPLSHKLISLVNALTNSLYGCPSPKVPR